VNFAGCIGVDRAAGAFQIASPRCNIELLRLSLLREKDCVCASLQFSLIQGDKINFQRQARRQQQEMIRFLCLSFSIAAERARP
jgi:hypothetical protein